MRYYELLEEITASERAQKNGEKRRAANAKLDAARQRKVTAAQRYQAAIRSSDDAAQSAKNALAGTP